MATRLGNKVHLHNVMLVSYSQDHMHTQLILLVVSILIVLKTISRDNTQFEHNCIKTFSRGNTCTQFLCSQHNYIKAISRVKRSLVSLLSHQALVQQLLGVQLHLEPHLLAPVPHLLYAHL